MRPSATTRQSEPADRHGEQPSPESDWIARSRQGDMAAYGELVRACQDRVFNACWRMCGSREDAEDVTQEAFVRAFQQIARFEGRSRFYTWVYRIAVNLILTERRRSIHRTVSLDAPGARQRSGDSPTGGQSRTLSNQIATDERGPPEHAASRESQETVTAALAKLEPEHRAVIIMRDLDNLDYDEIAAILGVPRGTVKSRLHRGRAALREWLADVHGEY